MTQTPAGWYPDPDPTAATTQPGRQRWWDGTRWTEHVGGGAPVSQARPTGPDGTPVESYTAAYGPGFGTGYDPSAAAAYGSAYGAGYGSGYGSGTPDRDHTPDGDVLAGWWRRVGGSLVDSVLVFALQLAIGFSLVRHIVTAARTYLRSVIDASNAGLPAPSSATFRDAVGHDGTLLGLIGIGLSFVYVVGFLMWLQATPGQLAFGMRVRRRDQPGRMPIGTVLLRWVGEDAISILRLVPVVGSLGSIYTLLDVLWPLWDGKRQALHDKLAGTNVVRIRR